MPYLIGFIVFILVFVIIPGFRVVRQFERGVVFTLGKYSGVRGPGLRVIIPGFQSMTRVDAIVYFRVLDPAKALLETTNYVYATTNFAQAALRDITGNFELDELLSKRDEISAQIKEIVDKETDKWGIDIENVKLQNIELPGDMKRAMAKQAEAERERRAAIIAAEGEKSAAKSVAEAAQLLAHTPGGIQIRTLQTLEKISSDPSQKTVIVLPDGMKDLAHKIAG